MDTIINLIGSCIDLLHYVSDLAGELIAQAPYLRIFIFMTVESSFIPFPSEVVMIPAGYYASQGDINLFLAIIIGLAGSLAGALINYRLARLLGTGISKKLMGEKYYNMCINYFEKFGDITTFIGRLIPVVRQLISFPAGLFKMNMGKFLLYTGLGAGLWMTFLAVFGWVIGENKELYEEYKLYFYIGTIILIALIIWSKIYFLKKLNNKVNSPEKS